MQLFPVLLILATLAIIGCATQSPETISGISDVERASFSDEQMRLLNMAEEDFRLAAAGKEPKHALLKWALRDGGTKIYEGEGYSLAAHNGKFARHNGLDGRESGATMTLTKRIIGKGAKTLSTKQFISNTTTDQKRQ